MNRRSFLALASTLPLAACGFRLRGSGMQSMLPFSTVHIPAGSNAGLATELRRMVEATGDTKVIDDPKAVEAVIDILSESRTRGGETLNTAGRIREYSLYYHVSFRVRRPDGTMLLPATTIALKRDLSYNEAQAIAKEKEEEMLYRNMQSDAVQQILRRIAAIKQ